MPNYIIHYLCLKFICRPFQCQATERNNPLSHQTIIMKLLFQNKKNSLVVFVRNPAFSLPLPLRCQNTFQPFISHEVHPTGWNIWSNKQSQLRKMRDTTAHIGKDKKDKTCQLSVSRIIIMA